jgi:hypothetical protein
VTVVHGTLARWTLEPNGRAQLLVQGRLLTVGLQAGALEAEVRRGSWPEAFAVEVGRTRIAVHGTRFRVGRTSLGAKVTLQEGTVVIGSVRDRGHMSGTLLTAPNHARVDLSGQLQPTDTLPARTKQQGSGERLVAQRRSVSSRQQSDPAATPVPAHSAVAPPENSAEPRSKNDPSSVAAEMDVAERAVRECFARHTHPAGGVLVTARTELTLRIAPSGAVTRMELRPPLAPPVERCAAAALGSLDFGASQRGGSESRVLFLGR